jgi:F-type H+-transporting ATPase subunit gamma
MANIKELKKKIKSTKSTHKITKAMKLVSAAKLSKAQSRILSLKPYSEELQKTVKKMTAVVSGYSHPLFNDVQSPNAVLLVISSDKGLCGSYNSGLTKKIRMFLKEHSHLSFKLFFIGKKVKDLLQKEVNVGEHFKFRKSEPTVEELRQVSEKLAEMFRGKEVGKVYIAYNTFFSAMNYNPVVKQILPFTLSAAEIESMAGNLKEYKYEPSAESILDVLIPEVYFNSINTALLDAIASEHGARMVSMENASKNCSEVIRKRTLKMNKLRQAAITTELTEVVSGAESLKG